MRFLIFSCLTIIAISLLGFKNNFKKPKTEAQLGKLLFFDPILSGNNQLSCASCHIPEFAFADTVALSKGVDNKVAKRNTPSVMNMASREKLFWDGRAENLNEQVLFPIKDANEMNCPIDTAIARLNANKKYKSYFNKIYKQDPSAKNLEAAIAAYERTLETSNTANDRWIAELKDGLNQQQIRGREVFFNKGKCIECHFTPDFTGDEFRNIGLFDGKKWNDSGRYNVTHKPEDIGKFKVPGLRNVAITAPYMHDGSMATLEEVIAFYNEPNTVLQSATPRDSFLQKPLQLSNNEMQDLKAFLIGLTDKKFIHLLKEN